jgi:flagellar hook-basal body complex protein FliE
MMDNPKNTENNDNIDHLLKEHTKKVEEAKQKSKKAKEDADLAIKEGLDKIHSIHQKNQR